jgi:hypothetical protein
MCRSIRTLRGTEPPATSADVRAAALKFVRKLSGYRAPSAANRAAFDAAVDEVAAATERLLEGITARGTAQPGAERSLAAHGQPAERHRPG